MALAPPSPLPDLISSLEHATLMAKHLPSTTDQTQLLQIYSSLHHAHHRLSSFLSTENSLSYAEPMQVVGDGEAEAEESSGKTTEKVDARFKDRLIKNKRSKRPLSPAAEGEETRWSGDGCFGAVKAFDNYGSKLEALDFVYQFHA